MTPPAPTRSTLFPYTTLFRSCEAKPLAHYAQSRAWRGHREGPVAPGNLAIFDAKHWQSSWALFTFQKAIINIPYERSEEHTSELQSLRHLVCRLLLEKKNKKK